MPLHGFPDPPTPDGASSLPMAAGEVHLWLWIATADVTQIGARLLSAAERRRAAQFQTLALEQHYVAARGLSRHMLGLYLGAPGDKLAIEEDAKGKPRLAVPHLADAPLTFNVTHAGDIVLLAVAPDMEVGVDVEQVRSLGEREDDALDLARQSCTPQELATLAALRPAERPRAFARIWTCKEAVGKACGEGLGLDLQAFAVPYPQLTGAATVPADGRRAAQTFSITALPVGLGCEAALASARPPSRILYGSGVPRTATEARAQLSALPWSQ